MDKIKKKIILEIKFYFFSTFQKITVGEFLNQLINKFWPKWIREQTTIIVNGGKKIKAKLTNTFRRTTVRYRYASHICVETKHTNINSLKFTVNILKF